MMKSSWVAACVIVVALSLWLASGMIKPENVDETADNSTAAPMTVQVQRLSGETMRRELTLHGHLEPIQHVLIRAETQGTVEQITISKGNRVNQGDVVLRLDSGGRENSLAEAQARVKSAQSEQAAAESLRQQRLQSQLQLEQADANLGTALAQLAAIELDISNTAISAPFSGVLNDVRVDIGELVERGDIVAELLNDSAFTVNAQVSQQAVSGLSIGQSLTVKLITGEVLPGELSYISAIADPQIRSFSVEATVTNPNMVLAAGVSASLHIPTESVKATFISPSTLSLGDDGRLGVKAINDDDMVTFLPITLISSTIDGAWVSGIPDNTSVITLGHGFVTEGERVTPQEPSPAGGS